MSQLEDIQMAQKNLEEHFTKKMEELQVQLQCSSTSKDTVAKVAEEFRTFRELIYTMLGLLRNQINECTRAVDSMETRHRRKALIFLGVAETENENCSEVISHIINNKLSLKHMPPGAINVSHRLGSTRGDRPRPILVRFLNADVRASVWKAKTLLKGSSISLREFLTKIRQQVFGKARLHFGIHSCWTQDGVIVIKTPDNGRCKVTSHSDLEPLLLKYPKTLRQEK